LPSKFGHL